MKNPDKKRTLQSRLTVRWIQTLERYRLLRSRLGIAVSICIVAAAFLYFSEFFSIIYMWFIISLAAILIISVAVIARKVRIICECIDVCRREEAARLLSWTDLPEVTSLQPAKHAYASHLSVTGSQSLIRLVDRSGTPDGSSHLRKWLLRPDLTEEAHTCRRELVRSFEDDRTLRLRFRLAQINSTAPIASLARQPEKSQPKLLRWIAVYAFAWALILGSIFVGFSWFALVAVVFHIVRFAWTYDQHTLANNPRLSAVVALEAIERFASKIVSRVPGPISSKLCVLLDSDTGIPAFSQQLGILSWLEWTRNRPFLSFFLNTFIPFASIIETYQARAYRILADHSERWSVAWGELEAAASLAALSDRPDFSEAVLSKAGVLKLTAFGHPLLHDTHDVRNDITLAPGESAICLTGGNMSGKSTILRSLGLNLVLFQAGGLVKAKLAELPLLPIFASIDVVDDLSGGVSRFAAELEQIAQLTNYAYRNGATIFLIDEIFSTTNNVERRVGTVNIIKNLIDCGSMGIVTTHDAGVVEGLGSVRHVKRFHMGLDKTEKDLVPNYRMLPNQAPVGNAIYLMERAGVLLHPLDTQLPIA